MDLKTDSSDPPRRTTSPEVSTRPNPFDDSDVASRKRRRTSLSGSPSRSVNGSDPLRHALEPTDSPSVDDEASDGAMNIDNRPTTPKTPEQQTASGHQNQDPPSSKMTINLRKIAEADGSLPDSPSASVPMATVDVDNSNQQDTHNGPTFADMGPIDAGSSPPSSLSSGSPPVELVTIPDNDDDNIFDAPVEDITLGGQERYYPDPTDRFPYHDMHEHRLDTVIRLVQYIAQNQVLDENIIITTQSWLREFLGFMRTSSPTRLRQSLLAHRDMWLRYPDIPLAMNNRKPPLQLEPDYRLIILDFYRDLVQVTAHLVYLDITTLQLNARQDIATASEKQCPILFSGNFLHSVYCLTRREPLLDDDRNLSPSQGDKALLLRKLETSADGNLDKLIELITLLLGVLPNFPRLVITLAHVASVLSNLMQVALHRSTSGSIEERLVAASQLERTHVLWTEMSQALDGLMERSVSQLHSDTMSCITTALSSILKSCLRGSHQSAIELKESHQGLHPELPIDWVGEAIGHEWRFQVFGKLIRSSQMQLRVWAVTTMCNELVAVWKRFQDVPEHPMLKHLADCLLRSALIEYILGSNCHPEIIAESANIVGFLVVTRTYQQQHTDRFWHNITCSQDPRVADALVRMLVTIINIFDQSHLLEFCHKFLDLPVEDFTMPMHKLWDAVLNQLMDKSQKDGGFLDYLPYSLCLKLLREFSLTSSGNQAAVPDLQRVVMQKFKDLLTFGPDPSGRTMLYASCLDDIAKKSATSLGSLWALILTIGPAVEREVCSLSKDFSLPELVIGELEAAIESNDSETPPPVLWGSMNHPRRELIMNVVLFMPDVLDEELGGKLWDLLVGPRSPTSNDREAGWQILNEVVARSEAKNPFTRTCLTQRLPRLPPHCFCVGLLDFVKKEVSKLLHIAPDFQLDDEEAVKSSCLEQLWTIILTAEEFQLAGQAIHFLTVDVYMSSTVMSRYPAPRLEQGHALVVNRCFSQLKDAAERIQAAESIDEAVNNGEAMVVVESGEKMAQYERTFTRSLQLLRYFLDIYQARPELSTPDLRALMSRLPSQVEGDPAQLKYQSFDGTLQTEMKPLNIGKRNTAASLLASLSQETGFQNYKAYFRGRAFHPDVRQLCKSLEDLQIHEGLILVKRTEERTSLRGRGVKLGSSALQIDILQHFDELWQYLDLKESLATEIYQFLAKLPANYRILESFEDETASATDIFPPGHPFKALYTIHALYEYKDLTSQESLLDTTEVGPRVFPQRTAEEAKASSISLIVQALPYVQTPSRYSQPIQAKLASTLMHILGQWIEQGTNLSDLKTNVDISSWGITSPDVFVDILSRAATLLNDGYFEVLIYTLEAVLWLGLLDPTFWTSITSHEPFFNTTRALMLNEKKSIRFMAEKKIRDAVAREAGLDPRVSHHISQYFWALASELVEDVADHPERCQEAFELSFFILRDANKRWSQDMNFSALAAKFSSLLMRHTTSETISRFTPQDPVAKNLSEHLLLCLQADESIIRSGSLPPHLGQQLFWRHLFPAPRSTYEEPVPTVVLHSDTRALLSKIVFLLTKHDRNKLAQLLKDMASLVPVFTSEEEEPYIYELPQGFDRFRAIRSPCGYVGLRNLSNTCYLNSLLTQLFMNVPFRHFLLSSKVHDADNPLNLMFQTKKLFAFMQESYRRFVDPADMISCIKTYDDTLIDIHSQMDVDEFYNLLFDRWESLLVSPVEKRKFRSFFGGHLVQQVKSQECEHISERLEPFSAIQCDIKGKTSLAESLQAYVDGEILDGDNKYKCSTCDRHVDAVKRACLKDIPDNVIFHLKRFDFNLRTLQRSKINDYFSFPGKINLAPYTVEHIRGEVVEDDMFELVGVLVHAGTAESGHYYSYIRERPSQEGLATWVEFNDDNVSTWDPCLMEASTFGGTNRPQPPDPSGLLYDKPYSAYMLFYQRSSTLAEQEQEVARQGVPTPVYVPMDSNQKGCILEENDQILKRHCMFDPSHPNLVREVFCHAKKIYSEANEDSEIDDEDDEDDEIDGPEEPVSSGVLMGLAMEVLLGHFDQVISRAKDIPYHDDFATVIRNSITFDSQCTFAFYDYFYTRPMALRSLVQRNAELKVRETAGEMFVLALDRLSIFVPFLYDSAMDDVPFVVQQRIRQNFWLQRGRDPTDQPTILQGTMRVLKHMWKGFPTHIRAWDEFFKMILEIAKLGHRETAHLLADNFLVKLCRIIMADPTFEQPPLYMRLVQNITRRFPNRPPSYYNIIRAADYLFHQLTPTLGPGTIVDSPLERLDSNTAPFMWTSDEAAMLHLQATRRRDVSFFVEKLVGHDQSLQATERILVRLMHASEMLDLNVANSLMNGIRRDDTLSGVEPYLKMANRYLEHTEYIDRALQLVSHVAKQSNRLQSIDFRGLINFFKLVLGLQRPDQDAADQIRDHCVEVMPSWVPCLLVHYNGMVRVTTAEMVENLLFGPRAEVRFDDIDIPEDDRRRTNEVARRLGFACLEYVRDHFVQHNTTIGRDQAQMINRIISRCGHVFELVDETTSAESTVEFGLLRAEVIEQLRGLVVDDMEEEGSEWDASCVSSEPMDGIAEMSMQVMKDLEDRDTT